MFVVITSGRHDDRTRGHWAVQPMLVTRVIEAFDGAGPNVDPFDATAVVVVRGQPGRSPCRNSPRCALPSCSSRGPPGCRHRWTASASASARRQRAAGLAGRPQPSQRIWRQALHSRAPGEHGEPGLQPERARTALEGRGVLGAFEASAGGVVAHDGQMINRPVAERARRILGQSMG